ncbi:APC family permease [Fodinicola feengrottensis]|uniref:APC family permease n=1 Tax=Fodinicola feengrottensis TaxID=435914 RepID=UPI002442250B|nr:APC family permease [Fodinicola feengrottensis]
MLAFLVCTMVGLDTIGSVAAHGPQGLVWMVILAAVFLLPYGMLVSELSTAIPVEGGPYVWTKLAFGKFVAAINQVMYWFSNPVWVGGTLCILAVTTFQTFFFPLPGFWGYLGGLVFIWATVLGVLAALNIGKWIPTAGAFVRILMLGFFVVTAIVYGVQHGIQPLTGSAFAPSYLGFIALVPVLIFNYVGFELPSNAAEEMTNPQRDIPFAVLRTGFGAFILYGGPILCILLVLPAKQINGLGGFLDAVKAVFTVYGGSVHSDGTVELSGAGAVFAGICAAGFIIGLLTSGVTWSMGGDRAQAVACTDGAGPAWLGKISPRFGTPVRINVLSGILSTIMMVLARVLTSGDGQKYFSAALGLAISTTFFTYIAMFPALTVLRRKLPDLPRPYQVPGGRIGAWVVSSVTGLIVLFTVVVLLWPGFGVGWFGTSGSPDDSLPASFAGQRLGYTLSQVLPLLAIILVGVIFFVVGSYQLRKADREPDLIS